MTSIPSCLTRLHRTDLTLFRSLDRQMLLTMHSHSLLTLFSIPALLSSLAAALPQPPSASKNADPKSLLACVQNVLGSNGASRIITPSNDQYLSARTGSILVDQFPALVVYANKVNELGPLVKCGVANGFLIAPRAGSHHFENWSALTGSLVIDLSNINYILPSEGAKTAVVGGGARLGAIYSVLDGYGKSFAGGICPSVGIGGHLNVGGYNMQMRTEGLAVDNLESARVVLANGDLVTASATSNPELWYAMRGGGTYGITADVVIKTTTLPRSAMFSMNFGKDTRLEVTKKFLNWASKQDPLFNSQLNLFSDRTNILGWYLGKDKAELSAIVATSGLAEVAGADIKISGNCSVSNSRNFWLGLQDTCTDDATAEKLFYSMNNVAADALTPVQSNGLVSVLSQVPVLPNVPRANKWARANVASKTFVEKKDNPLNDAAIEWLVTESGKVPLLAGFWAEITTFNMSSKATTSAFPWQGQAKTLFRMQVTKGLSDKNAQSQADAFIKSTETYLRPRFG
jgi:FAD/FMN-containing dehydrogenase